MINWILGGGIFFLTGFVIFRMVKKVSKGQTGCCSGCTSCTCNDHVKQ